MVNVLWKYHRHDGFVAPRFVAPPGHLDRQTFNADDFAREIECSTSHLRNIIARRRRPSIDLLDRIVNKTKGHVGIAAFETEAAE
jgi:hypothetical protein